MTTTTEFVVPVLYILMRSELDSMNCGKQIAQGAHAANQFMYEAERNKLPFDCVDLYEAWLSGGEGFGTTIVLDVTEQQLHDTVRFMRRANIPADVTHDPSYPLQDGAMTHLIPLDTCGYVFGDKDDLSPLLRQFNLLP